MVRVRRGLVLAMAVCLLSIPIVAPRASAQPTETIETLTTTLPWTLEAGTAVSTGTTIYLIGGFRGGAYSDRITRFDPTNRTFANETARLPFPLLGVAGVWTGEEILIFGGQTQGGGNSALTMRYNPATGDLAFGANLTSSRAYAPTVWTGRYAYLFGGAVGLTSIRYDVLRYDPQTDTMQVVTTATMPTNARDGSATWDGTRAVVFGGVYEVHVMTFDPATETFSQASVSGFGGATMTTAAQIGPYAYVFGGLRQNGLSAAITRFRTDSTVAETSSANLSRNSGLVASAVVGDRAYLFGGWNGYSDSNQIQVFRSVNNASPLGIVLWIGIAAIVVAAVAGAAFVVRRRRRTRTPPGSTPPT